MGTRGPAPTHPPSVPLAPRRGVSVWGMFGAAPRLLPFLCEGGCPLCAGGAACSRRRTGPEPQGRHHDCLWPHGEGIRRVVANGHDDPLRGFKPVPRFAAQTRGRTTLSPEARIRSTTRPAGWRPALPTLGEPRAKLSRRASATMARQELPGQWNRLLAVPRTVFEEDEEVVRILRPPSCPVLSRTPHGVRESSEAVFS